MKNNKEQILITGATGNVGSEVINALYKLTHSFEIIAALRDVEKDKSKLTEYQIGFVKLDMTDISTYQPALSSIDILFLLRPPQISEVEKYFKPFIETAVKCGIKHIVFLSVQGVENSSIIPHHKIEKLIVDSGIPYTFLRPAYFMQNFTTTLQNDLIQNKRIFLPAGKALFTLVDVRDIGSVAAVILTNVSYYSNKSYELTCNERLTFQQMADKLSKGLNTKIEYISPNLLQFLITKRKENVPTMLILVMIMLHYFPRFQKRPPMTDWIEKITGKTPISFDEFIEDNLGKLKVIL